MPSRLPASGEMLLTYDSPVSALFTPFLEGVSERSERGGVWTQCVGQVAHFNLTPENLFMLMV